MRDTDTKKTLESVLLDKGGQTKSLLDKTGRGIPQEEMTGHVCDENKSYKLEQLVPDYAKRLMRLQEFFSQGCQFVTAEEFQTRSEAIVAKLWANEPMKTLVKRVYLPIALPYLPGFDPRQYGKTLEEMFLLAVKGSYEQCFANAEEPKKSRKLNNYRKGQLKGQVTVIDGTRHDKLIDAMVQAPTVALYFPNPLQGFSIPAAREFITYLPEEFLLSGGFDTATAMVAYPDVLARDYQTPCLDMAALQWMSAEDSLYFEALGESLGFRRGSLGAHGSFSSGFVLLG